MGGVVDGLFTTEEGENCSITFDGRADILHPLPKLGMLRLHHGKAGIENLFYTVSCPSFFKADLNFSSKVTMMEPLILLAVTAITASPKSAIFDGQ